MGRYVEQHSANTTINLRNYEDASIVPDILNIGLVKVRVVACSAKIKILNFNSTLIWTGKGFPDRYRFGRITCYYFGSVVQEIFLNWQEQWIIPIGIYLPVEFFQADENIAFASLPANIGFRCDSFSVEIAPSVSYEVVINLLRSQEYSGVTGII